MTLGLVTRLIFRSGITLILSAVTLPLQVSLLGAPGYSTATGLTVSDIDPGSYSEWVDGREIPVSGTNGNATPTWILWTQTTHPGHSGYAYGKTATPGERHLRIGFNREIAVGSVIVKGGGSLSVLKASAPYPGKLDKQEDWIPAERLQDGKITTNEISADHEDIWILPPGTTTRALRFSHQAAVTDPDYEGKLGGAVILKDRFVNIAPMARATAKSESQNAYKINDGKSDFPRYWENREYKAGERDGTNENTPPSEWLRLSWPVPVTVCGLGLVAPGFGSASLEFLCETNQPGPSNLEQWIPSGDYRDILNGYGISFAPWMIFFPGIGTTRSIRLNLTSPTRESHPQLHGATMGGRRYWIDEVMVLSPLGERPLAEFKPPLPAPPDTGGEAASGPIPVSFTLGKPGFVTLVIEDMQGRRVRNLISDTYFSAGRHVIPWDGSDDLLRDPDAAHHGVFHIPFRTVAAGEYRVRGLVHGEITPRYEFSFYNPGTPPWNTSDHTGAWLGNHTPPQAAAFAPPDKNPWGKPLVFLGSYISEGPDGMIWVDLEGHKQGGKRNVGRAWTCAPYIAIDTGYHPLPGKPVYVGSVWNAIRRSTTAELLITAVGTNSEKTIFSEDFISADPTDMGHEIAGLAAHDGILVASLPGQGKLRLIDASQGIGAGSLSLRDCRGVAFDAGGRLFAVAGKKVLRYDPDPTGKPGTDPVEVVSEGLEDPRQITVDSTGRLYVSDWGASHQVKVFCPPADGNARFRLEKTIGHPGEPKAGPYDPQHMNHPSGLAIDSQYHLWVAEQDMLPKRISVWSRDGKLIRAFYGPSKYGGGGTLDPRDRSLLYYGENGTGGMAFRLDWERGLSELKDIYYRPGPGSIRLGFRSAAPELALYHEGRRYLANCYNTAPTAGANTAFLFLDQGGVARPVAAIGRAGEWDILKSPPFRSRWPEGVDPLSPNPFRNEAYFCWSDRHSDGAVHPEDVTILKGSCRGITIMPDFTFCAAWLDGRTVGFPPVDFSRAGVPSYEINNPKILAEGVLGPVADGGDQALHAADGRTMITMGISPFSKESLCGALMGKAEWSYPTLWPGLHASHESPLPEKNGELIGTTRLMGGFFPAGNPAGDLLWAINGNLGNVTVFTADGLMVKTLFPDSREAKAWGMPLAVRGMDLSGNSLGQENFFPTIGSCGDGGVYLVDGTHAGILKIHGLDSIRRIPESRLRVTPEQLSRALEQARGIERSSQDDSAGLPMIIRKVAQAPELDASFSGWKGEWVDIDKRGVKAFFNSDSRPYEVSGSLLMAGDRLYAAFRTGDPKLLRNTGEQATALFKTGGALDLMIGGDPTADSCRKLPVVGDCRLIVTLVGGKPRALLYRAVVPGTDARTAVPFSSPDRTVTFDQVRDVSNEVRFAANGGNYEFSVPLDLLGLKPEEGTRIRGDLGILRGSEGTTTARVYWSNKATGITSDVPSEAELRPDLWGTMIVQP